ncbi:MAG TPA: MBG domain-containing protein, partial [Flavisolibacter sp.]|nr:MBG domain-containing protein [Flavisolibacter sp.]
KLEGMANPELTASYSGFVSGESQSVLTSLPGLSTAASTLSPAGTYDIDVKNAAADNYDITYVKGTLTVNPLANNLKVSSTSESCKTSNNGEINITATQPLTYTATITGNSTPNSYSFTSSKKIDNLSAGTYNVCVTAEELVGYQQCYNVEVTEPKDLSAYARVNRNQKTITVDLSGAARYWIELNGKIYSTTESQITLPALSTNNVLKVATDKPCQGVIERNINLSGEVLVYPNPFSDKVRIDLGSSDASKVQVEVSDLLGKKVYSATLVNNNNIEVDLSSLVTGVYMVKVTAGNSISTHKIIKK